MGMCLGIIEIFLVSGFSYSKIVLILDLLKKHPPEHFNHEHPLRYSITPGEFFLIIGESDREYHRITDSLLYIVLFNG